MEIIKFLIKKILYILPYKKLVKYYDKISNTKIVDLLNKVYRDRFFVESELVKDIDGVLSKIAKTNKYCIINAGEFEYKLFNFCFVKDMISLIIYSIERGYMPVINVKSKVDNDNLWEQFLIQPFSNDIEEAYSGDFVICNRKTYIIRPSFSDTYDNKQVKVWCKLFEKLVIINPIAKSYMDDEYNHIIKGKKVLACLGRGTDYTSTKPSGHPIQPELNELLLKVEEVFEQQNVDYIYLATEEKRIADAFNNKFPGKILENKRFYFDEKFKTLDKSQLISAVSFDRDNDNYLKALEYFSSINLVSKCDSFVAGLCGGSEIAIYLNNSRYNYLYIFDKGYY